MPTLEQPRVGNQPAPRMPDRVSLEQVIKYDVYDSTDDRIGSASAVWVDGENRPAFIGVKTTWLVGKTHVIPVWGVEVNHQAQRIRLPCRGDIVKEAPSFAPDEELNDEEERQILAYYASKGACQPRVKAGAAGRIGSAEETRIPLHEEQVKVGKRTVEAGGVRLRKIVRTETVQQPVTLKREDIQVEHVPTGGQQPSGTAFQPQDIYIPLRREEPVVEKQPRVREEIRVRKTAGAEQQKVSDEVRKEDVEIEQKGHKTGSY